MKKYDSSCIRFFNKPEWDKTIIEEVLDEDVYEFSNWKPSRQPKFIVDVGGHIGTFSY